MHRIIDCEYETANGNESYKNKTPKWQDEAYKGLPIYQSIKINL